MASSDNCLERFMELFDLVEEFLDNNDDMKLLKSVEAEALVSYLTNIFKKHRFLNIQLQGSSFTLVDT